MIHAHWLRLKPGGYHGAIPAKRKEGSAAIDAALSGFTLLSRV
jgi:hypothetical protein